MGLPYKDLIIDVVLHDVTVTMQILRTKCGFVLNTGFLYGMVWHRILKVARLEQLLKNYDLDFWACDLSRSLKVIKQGDRRVAVTT